MTLYDWRHGMLPPGRVFDADGNRLRHVVWCETDTGRFLRYVVDDNGFPTFAWGENDRSVPITEMITAPAPLSVEFDVPRSIIA